MEDLEGKHKYKLIGVVENVAVFGRHFVAKLKLDDGKWYRISDIGNTKPEEITFDHSSRLSMQVYYERVEE